MDRGQNQDEPDETGETSILLLRDQRKKQFARIIIACCLLHIMEPLYAEDQKNNGCGDWPDTSSMCQGIILENKTAKADLALNQTYQELLKKLSKNDRQALISEERAWIRHRDKTCRKENQQGGINGIGWATCNYSMTLERLGDLKSRLP
jgi:uncharacterized protein YecT (DUF1311 family)